mmetsp:Transcript_54295/g.119019  ORF Transcript_54295/g.119019 Transcript_54295/m.119019 type:complete len:399 (+) Transcript_54295:36-1232(+)
MVTNVRLRDGVRALVLAVRGHLILLARQPFGQGALLQFEVGGVHVRAFAAGGVLLRDQSLVLLVVVHHALNVLHNGPILPKILHPRLRPALGKPVIPVLSLATAQVLGARPVAHAVPPLHLSVALLASGGGTLDLQLGDIPVGGVALLLGPLQLRGVLLAGCLLSVVLCLLDHQEALQLRNRVQCSAVALLRGLRIHVAVRKALAEVGLDHAVVLLEIQTIPLLGLLQIAHFAVAVSVHLLGGGELQVARVVVVTDAGGPGLLVVAHFVLLALSLITQMDLLKGRRQVGGILLVGGDDRGLQHGADHLLQLLGQGHGFLGGHGGVGGGAEEVKMGDDVLEEAVQNTAVTGQGRMGSGLHLHQRDGVLCQDIGLLRQHPHRPTRAHLHLQVVGHRHGQK